MGKTNLYPLCLLVCISIIHISYWFETETMDVVERLSKYFHGIQETVGLEIFMGWVIKALNHSNMKRQRDLDGTVTY